MPERITLCRKAGWRMPDHTINVSRSSHSSGNPYRIYRPKEHEFFIQLPQDMVDEGGVLRPVFKPNPTWGIAVSNFSAWTDCNNNLTTITETGETQIGELFPTRHAAHERAVQLYEEWILSEHQQERLNKYKRWLHGHNLACWCPLNMPCHADILLRLCN